ncbi:MAG: hypothetical protein M0P71_08220 [Melioribacteraceae bacterium]|nr:hypothetical protein [Melioribacteraceae bacterium]
MTIQEQDKSYLRILGFLLVVISLVFVIGCSDDESAVEVKVSDNSQVEGRVYGDESLSKILAKTSSAQAVSGAAVILAQVQADGSLKTVSNKSVTTDAEGKFLIETNLSGVKNLVIKATKDNMQWKAIVSAEVKKNTKVYAPPVNKDSDSRAELYISLAVEGKTGSVSLLDFNLLANTNLAIKLLLTSYMSALESINAKVNESGGAKAELNVNLSASASTTAAENAYLAFYTKIKTLVNTSLVGASQSQINAATDIIILTNLH